MTTSSNAIVRLLTEREAADILKISARTLEAWRTQGGGPMFIRLRGCAIRYRQTDIEKFIECGLLKSTSDVGNNAAKSGFCDRGRK